MFLSKILAKPLSNFESNLPAMSQVLVTAHVFSTMKLWNVAIGRKPSLQAELMDHFMEIQERNCW